MLTASLMLILVAFLGFLIVIADKKSKTTSFFDLQNTNCMRGFWCIIIVLVHIPPAFQNRIQDALGSFAYIGVSFFFMTSAYGLMLGVERDSQAVKKGFWLRRLPKLLVPMFIVNILRVVTEALALKEFSPLGFISITGFVSQLLLFYLFFWLAFKFLPDKLSLGKKGAVVCVAVTIFSLVVYFYNDYLPFGWHVESFGFAYGILLALFKEKFKQLANKGWLVKCAVACVISLALGIAYLKFKVIVFLGDYIVKALLGLAILLFMLLLNTRVSIGNPVIRFIGKISYEVYLIHDVVFIALAAISPNMNSGLFVLSSIVLAVLLSVAVNKLSGAVLKCFMK